MSHHGEYFVSYQPLEEGTDQLEQWRETEHAPGKFKEPLEECNEPVNSHSNTEEASHQEVNDYIPHPELVCDENIGRRSPEAFPEYVPGAWDEVRQHRTIAPGKPTMRFRTELDAGDVKLVNELGQLSVDHLLDYMKNLQNNAFLLGEEETKEFQRAKCLDLFKK